jgi:MFS family permease
MFGLGSIGSIFAALVAARLAKHIKVGWLIVLAAAVFSLGGVFTILAVPPYGGYLLSVSVFIGSFGGVAYNVNQVSYRQALVPLRLQGRLNATMRFIVTGINPIGALIGGEIGQSFGLYPALVTGAVVGFISPLWVLLSPVRKVETIPSVPEESDAKA